MYRFLVFFCIFFQSLFAGYADFTAQFKACPEKLQAWQKMAEKIDHTVDRLECPIDEKIKEAVIVLNLLGFKTVASCEGHLDWGTLYPWIDIEVVKEETFEAFNKNLRISLKEIDRLEMELKHEGVDVHRNQRWIELHTRNAELWHSSEKYYLQQGYPVFQLLRGFYRECPLSYDTAILPQRLANRLRIYSSDGEWQLIRTEEEKKAKLLEYRQEMDRFTEFLIEKFLANP